MKRGMCNILWRFPDSPTDFWRQGSLESSQNGVCELHSFSKQEWFVLNCFFLCPHFLKIQLQQYQLQSCPCNHVILVRNDLFPQDQCSAVAEREKAKVTNSRGGTIPYLDGVKEKLPKIDTKDSLGKAILTILLDNWWLCWQGHHQLSGRSDENNNFTQTK